MSYTCISCRVAFADGDVQRAHYKTDWHRYNLKRKVADMPPVTAENFQERVLAQRAAAEQQVNQSGATESCDVCNKKFSSVNAYQNHLKSHKHLQAEKQALKAAQTEVDKMNEKNLEKGLGLEKVDNDARNEALQEALKKRQKQPPASQPLLHTEPSVSRPRADRPPRSQWLEEQARRREREETPTPTTTAEPEEEWEDVEDDDDDMEDDEDDVEEEMDEGQKEQAHSESRVLPGSLPVTDCLFCSHHSRSLIKNLHHMTTVHSFFIPDIEFLIDLKGLIQYLGEKVGAGNVCLWCNEKGRSFYSTEAVQSHMTDKSHCKLFTEGDAALEFADFYDFRSSYPDRKEGEDVQMEDSEVPDDTDLQYDEDTLQLTLPSGAVIGHRSLMRYYKQKFGTQRHVAVYQNHNSRAVGRVLRQYKALGWAGVGGGSLHQKPKDMQYVQMMKSKWILKLGMSHNATKQKHFRAQVMF